MHQRRDYLHRTWVHRRQNIRDYVVVPHNITREGAPSRSKRGTGQRPSPFTAVDLWSRPPNPGPFGPCEQSSLYTKVTRPWPQLPQVFCRGLPRPRANSDTRENRIFSLCFNYSRPRPIHASNSGRPLGRPPITSTNSRESPYLPVNINYFQAKSQYSHVLMGFICRIPLIIGTSWWSFRLIFTFHMDFATFHAYY